MYLLERANTRPFTTCTHTRITSTDDVFEMSVVRGVGEVCDVCMCLARGGVGGKGGKSMRELGLGFFNPVGTGGVLNVCLWVV